MTVSGLPNYGKDYLTIEASAGWSRLSWSLPVARYYFSVARALGAGGLVSALAAIRVESASARSLDWSPLIERGLSPHNLDQILKSTVRSKIIADRLGLKKAAHLHRQMALRTAYPAMERVFASPEAFLRLGEGDFLSPFKAYFQAYLAAMGRAGLQEGQVVEDTPESFGVNICYCAWAEVAKALGNPRYCYYSLCHADEIFFPRFLEAGGLRFERYGTLAQNEACCDYRFTRLP